MVVSLIKERLNLLYKKVNRKKNPILQTHYCRSRYLYYEKSRISIVKNAVVLINKYNADEAAIYYVRITVNGWYTQRSKES